MFNNRKAAEFLLIEILNLLITQKIKARFVETETL